jgi:squalene-associated FAD-dependent desaturase
MASSSSIIDTPSVIVIGGGLAGIAAAVRLAQAGRRVTLVETRQRLGGRATSFSDPTTGDLLDNCQHVLLGCCTSLIDLYDRLGVQGMIEWHTRLYFMGAAGCVDTLEADDLPAPLHMTRALMGFRNLSLRDKLAISRGMLAMMRVGREGRRRLGDVSFAEWLVQHGQPRSAIDRFWSVIIISACNEQPERVAARYAMQVFQDGFLNHERSYVMGLAAAPLVKLYDPATELIERAGGRVMLSSSAQQLVVRGARVCALQLADGSEMTADSYVSAVPFDRLAKLLPPDAREADERFRGLDRFTVSPIIGVHLFFDAPVMRLPHLILMDSPLQWIFNKGDAEGEQHLHGVISAAHDLVDQPADEIAAMVEREMRRALGTTAGRVTHQRVVKEKRATFSVAPGSDAWRPKPTGAIANLVLAGDWTDTGWPATMEGAVRSGYVAAAALLDPSHDAQPLDLPDSRLYRLIAGK